jgi:hypothetical protein
MPYPLSVGQKVKIHPDFVKFIKELDYDESPDVNYIYEIVEIGMPDGDGLRVITVDACLWDGSSRIAQICIGAGYLKSYNRPPIMTFIPVDAENMDKPGYWNAICKRCGSPAFMGAVLIECSRGDVCSQ